MPKERALLSQMSIMEDFVTPQTAFENQDPLKNNHKNLQDRLLKAIQTIETLTGSVSLTSTLKSAQPSIERLVRAVAIAEQNALIHMTAKEDFEDPELEDSPRILKMALDYHGLRISEKFYKNCEFDDLIEIYTLDHFQIFRTFNFYRLSNYTLEDILLNEWYNLYERPAHITTELMAHVTAHISGNLDVSHFSVGTHIMKEIFAEPRGAFLTRFKSLATAYDSSGKPEAFVCSISVKPLPIEETHNLQLLSLSQI